MPGPRPRAVVFDFDLTLADSRAGFAECHRFAAEAMGLAPLDADAIGRTIGTPLPLAFRELYPPEAYGLAEEYVRRYQARADEVMTGLTTMLDGAAATVRELAAGGLRLAILSQKLRLRVAAVLQREGLLSVFDAVLGAEDVPDFKPDPRGLVLALARLGCAPEEGVFVGDTPIDAEAARRACVPFVGVLSGYATAAEFAAYAPLAVLDSVATLPPWLGLPAPIQARGAG